VKEWIEPPAVHVPEPLRAAVGGHPLVAETLARRGFVEVEAAMAFLDPDLHSPAPPSDLPGMDVAVERLERAIRQGEPVCVWGDFDVDGQTSTTALLFTLRDLGAVATFYIPNRRREPRGLNLPALERLIGEGVRLVLTCDTGITAHEAIAYAQERGVDVVVTDHHDLPPDLPEACAVVNPKMLPPEHPLRELPGVGCAYKVIEELYCRAGRPAGAARHLDLVALGIVADVAVQTGDVRYLLQRGLESLRHTERLGLRALMETAELDPDRLTEEHIGFVLGPRLNALGRLADASVAVEFLTTRDLTRARVLATELEGLNAQRRLLCDQVTQAALDQVERDPSLLEDAALVLSHPSWPPGVIGVVAGRLAERYDRPVVLIATPPGEPGRGSARSVEGCSVNDAFAAHADMLLRFGGHPMAAGLTIEPERIPAFRRALSRTVGEMLGTDREKPALQIDGYLALADLSLDLVEQLERLAPFGPGNPSLVFVSKGLSLLSHSAVGRGGEHLQLVVEDEGDAAQKVIWWHGAGQPLPDGRFDLAYLVRTSDYRGRREVQVVWVDARQVDAPVVLLRQRLSTLEAVDYRREPDPHQVLERLRAQGDVQVWAEAGARAEVNGRDRGELVPSEALVIWTTPPGPGVLRAALEKALPARIYLLGVDPGLDQPKMFLERLAGLAKHALRTHRGRVSLSTLAAAMAQREMVVRKGIAWLVARGHLAVVNEEEGELWLAEGDRESAATLSQIATQLKTLLEETAAYRAYFARAARGTLW
jgi:single-stranded-DNA-specific exonuclease